MAQQTAMQALVELMKINDIYKPCMPYLMEIIDEVYLPMEKEQIMRASKDGISHGYTEGVVFGTNPRDYILKWSEQYYNETYGE